MTLDQLCGEYGTLRNEVHLLVQRRLLDLMREMVQNQRLTPNAVAEFQAISARWDLLDFEWTDENALQE